MGNCCQLSNNPMKEKQGQLEPTQKDIECHICLQMTTSTSKLFKLGCKHIFHRLCLFKAYEVKIYQRNFPMKCPDCNQEVDYYFLKALLSENLFTLYEKVLLINCLLLDEHIFFCPTPDCPAIYEIIPSDFRQFICLNCDKQYCLICHKKYHGKSSCIVQTKQEIAQHTTQCPRCKADWFKTTGCNHVTCKVCQYNFCYKCGGTQCKSYECANQKQKLY